MQIATSPTACLKKFTILMLFSVCAMYVSAQNGIYEKKLPNGAYGVISYQQSGNSVKAEVFTWWNSANAQTGSYYGEGTLKNGTVTLHSDENEPGCKVTLSLVQGKIKASFANCAIDHLTSDFNGQYTKISGAVAGNYIVTAPKAYFYKKTDAASKLKAYVLKGDVVTIDMQNVAANNNTWVFVSYMNKANKETTGFMLLSDLKKKE
ncbi:hypothetical protein [Mucilaginibacter sp. KACC 22063]|uniref:hypothetical protein n=1 Tax=Mucilaginibacter sp. KACC 22063 TaxID=3025666 RepID=UPI0023650BC6|nr:hypothetical protein [Mucilaginibacter sp. KACC 22063]WDF57386.1 hypothetical protein PQ461_09995 [Mucilaginibacter sp. KACC 22063]